MEAKVLQGNQAMMDHQDPRETLDQLDCQYVLHHLFTFLRHKHCLDCIFKLKLRLLF